MFLINGYKQESLAVAIGQRSLVMVVLPPPELSTESQFVIGAYPATTGCLSAVDISCDFWPQLEQEMKTLAAEHKMVY